MNIDHPIIQLHNVSKTYPGKHGDVRALHKVNLEIKKGDIFGIIGQSGAGKSTLVRTINVLERPTHGQISVNGVDMLTQNAKGLRAMRQHIGMIFQHFNLLSSRTVYQNIALPLEITRRSRADIKRKITPLLEWMGLEDKTHAYPSQLSGGQKQRVAIARALAMDPAVLLCDEATSALDPQSTLSILSLLKDINQRLGLTLVMITHEMNVIKHICNHVAVMQKGEVIEQGKVYDVFAYPKHVVTQTMLDALVHYNRDAVLSHRERVDTPEQGNPMVKLSFHGKPAKQPIVAELSQKFSIVPNILQANMENIQNQVLGFMVLELCGVNSETLSAIMSYLAARDIEVKVLGYVKPAY